MAYRKYIQDYIYLLIISGSVVLLDQLTKYLVRSNLAFSEMWSPWHWLLPYARIVHWQNTGAAFGMFQDLGAVFAVLAIIVSGAIIYYFPKVSKDDWAIRLALGLQLGGALGNLIDRLTMDYVVTDFISIGNFAVFNIADASITIGVVILIVTMWFRERENPQAEDEPDLETKGTTTGGITNPGQED